MSDPSRDEPEGPAAGDGRPGEQEPIPRLPRGRGFRPSLQDIVRILMFGGLLAAVLVLRGPCSQGVGRFVESFSPPADAGAARRPPVGELRRLSEDEIRARYRSLTRDGGAGEASGAHRGEGEGAPSSEPSATDRVKPSVGP